MLRMTNARGDSTRSQQPTIVHSGSEYKRTAVCKSTRGDSTLVRRYYQPGVQFSECKCKVLGICSFEYFLSEALLTIVYSVWITQAQNYSRRLHSLGDTTSQVYRVRNTQVEK